MTNRDTSHLLIARKDGCSRTRRQRIFATEADVNRAVSRWREDGYNVFWHYGPPTLAVGARALMRQWRQD